MGFEEMTVTIPLKRYESLLDSETRRVVLRDYLNRNNYVEREAMMRILGYLGDAEKIRDQEEKERQSYSITEAVEEADWVEGVIEDARAD